PSGAAQLNMDRERLLVRMEPEMTRWFAASEVEVMAAWRLLSDTLGRRVRVELPGETFEGVAEDLASDGSLIVAGRPVVAGARVTRPGSRGRVPRNGLELRLTISGRTSPERPRMTTAAAASSGVGSSLTITSGTARSTAARGTSAAG